MRLDGRFPFQSVIQEDIKDAKGRETNPQPKSTSNLHYQIEFIVASDVSINLKVWGHMQLDIILAKGVQGVCFDYFDFDSACMA